ncbi:MAG TPA: class I SAM-dependent methyltransferase [Burkholderiales bacterium]|nr:class I SAM-dependent methyltransferase [Burkholderiales bacterium]
MKKLASTLLWSCVLVATLAPAQERFSPYVPSDQENVERMLKLAQLRDDDVVVDLGSGDGRIVLTAARMNRKLRGWGVDIDKELVDRANAQARAMGVADRVQFFHRNAFDADLQEATVIAMWLWPEFQRLLRPQILAQARPGTRVITNLWDLGTWPPDEEDMEPQRVAKWIVPARVEGYWGWELSLEGRRVSYAAILEQRFQAAEGVARAGNRREVLHDVRLRGDEFSFTLNLTLDGLGYTRHEFRGRVLGDRIEGTAFLSPAPHEKSYQVPWRAARGATSAYFAPTGLVEPQK